MRGVRVLNASLMAGFLFASSTGIAWADRAPTQEERTAIEAVLRGAGFTSWGQIEFDDDVDPGDQLWEVSDAVGADGRAYDLKLSQSYAIMARIPD